MKISLPVFVAFCFLTPPLQAGTSGAVTLMQLPMGGIQPRAAASADGETQIVFFKGEPGGGDLFHAVLKRGNGSLSQPSQINSIPNSAVAAGTIRGAQLALGKRGRAHVVWNGSMKQKGDQPPLFYTHAKADGTGFEEQRPLSGGWLLDGGSAVAADAKGRVFVFFHGGQGNGRDEERRKVLIRISEDEGVTFEPERVISPADLGVCACCGMQAFADTGGRLFVIYRAAAEGGRRRDICTLFSSDSGRTWRHSIVDRWEINACPMSSMSIAQAGERVMMSWEREGQIYWGHWDDKLEKITGVQPMPGAGAGRKHPSLCANGTGHWLVVWTEGTGWNRGGSLAWQAFDPMLRPAGEAGRVPGVPVWSFVSALSTDGGGFKIWH